MRNFIRFLVNLYNSRNSRIVIAIIIWVAIFFAINYLFSGESGVVGSDGGNKDSAAVFAISTAISAIGFIVSIYAICYFDRYGTRIKRRRYKSRRIFNTHHNKMKK